MERGALLVIRGAEERPGDRYGEAADVFQRMRRRNERLTLFGEGDGCAVVLMLAQRFAPDALWLYPCGGTDADAFFRALGACGGNLFAVCAPIDVFLPEDMEEGITRRILRALRRTKAGRIEIQTLKPGTKAGNLIKNAANRFREIKTLA